MTNTSTSFRLSKAKPNPLRYLGFATVVAATGLSTSALAVDYTWTGSTNNTWSTAANWGGAAPANAASTAVFFGNPVSGRVAPNLTASATVGSVTFNSGASAFTISRSSSFTLTLANGGSVTNNSTNLQTFSTPIVLGGTSTWNAASGALAVSGTISGAGSSLIKTGTGVLTLTATNSYSGGTTISAGTLQIGTGGRLGTGGVTNSGILQYNNSTGNVAEANVISGTGRLNQIGTGTLSLTGSNTFQGGTTISAGTLQFSSLANFGSGTVALNGASLRWATGNTTDVSGILTVGSSGGILDTNGNNVTLASALAGSGTLTKTGSGVLSLASTYSYAGNTAITGGTIDFAAGTLGAGTALTINGGELRWGTGNTEGLTGKTISIGTGTGTLNTNGNNVTLAAALAGSGNIVKTGDGTLTLNAAGSSTAASTTVTGGVLRLGNAAALPTARALVVNGTTANGSATFDLNGNDFTVSTLTLGATTARANATNTVTTGAGTLFLGGDVTYTRATARANDPGTAYINGNLNLGSGVRTFSVAESSLTNSDLTINANITSGSSTGLTKTGAGVLVLAGTNTYSGSTTITAGAIRVSSADNLPAASNVKLNGGVLELAGDVALTYGTGAGQIQWTAGGGFSVYGGDRTVNYNGGAAVTWGTNFARTGTSFILSSVNSDSKTIFANDINLGGGTRTVSTSDGSAGVDAELSGAISNGNLSIVGNGTILLSGTNAYTGVISVDGGYLDVSSSLGIDSPASSLVLNGGTLISSGTGGSTNRLFQVNGTATTGYINSSGSGAIEFANSGSIVYGTANQIRDIEFEGTNTGNNIFRSTIGNNGTGAVRVNKSGSGSWTLSGSNSYTGLTYIYEGTLSVVGDYALGNTTGVTLLSNTTLNLDNVNTGSKLFSLSGAGASGTGALTFTGTSTISGTMRIDGTSLVIGGDGTLNLNAYMSEIYSFSAVTKVGSGTVVIHNPGIPDGLDWIIDGGLVILDTSSFTSMSGNLTTVNNGGTLRIAGSTNNQINDYTGLMVNSGGVVDLNGRYESVIALNGAGTVTNTAVGTAARLNLGVSDWYQDATFSGSLQDGAGTLALLKSGTNTGSFTLTGSNTYSGGTTLTSGTLVAGNNAAFGTGVIALNGGVLTGNAARTLGNALRLTNNSAIGGAANLTFTNVLTNSGGNRILTVSNTGTTTLGGVNLSNDNTGRTLTIDTSAGPVFITGAIANGGAGAGSLTKRGTATLTLSGSSNYTGATVVQAGALIVNGDNSGATGNVSVLGSLGGSGIVGGDTTIMAGGTLSPGNSPGTLTFENSLALDDGAFVLIEAGDLVDVNGTLTFADDWTLTLTSGFQDGGSTILFTYDTFGGSGLAPTFDISGLGFTPTGPLSLTDTGSAIVLNGVSVVPEPTALALLVGAGVVLMGARRRRGVKIEA